MNHFVCSCSLTISKSKSNMLPWVAWSKYFYDWFQLETVSYDKYVFTRLLIILRQTGHFVNEAAQLLQVTKWPQGINTTPNSLSTQILQSFSSLNLAFSCWSTALSPALDPCLRNSTSIDGVGVLHSVVSVDVPEWSDDPDAEECERSNSEFLFEVLWNCCCICFT